MSKQKSSRLLYTGSTVYLRSDGVSGVSSKTLTNTNTATLGDSPADWKVRVSLCQSATSSLVGTRFRIRPQYGTFYWRYAPGGWTESGYGSVTQGYWRWPAPAVVVNTIADRNAKSKFLKKYLSIKNTWRGGNFLAEIRETIHMVRHPVSSLYRETWKLARDVKHLGKVYRLSPTRYGRALSDLWLAWSFGVKPLISDCNDATSAFNKVSSRGFENEAFPGDAIPISAFGRDTSTVVTTGEWIPPGGLSGYGTAIFDDLTKSDSTVRYHGKVTATPQGAGQLIDQFGIGIFDVVPAVWEAIPYSFLVDYFLNVQEKLDSMHLWACNVSWLNKTIRNSQTINLLNLRLKTARSGLSAYYTGGRFYALGTFVSRDRTDVPTPEWYFTMPGFGSLKWLNIYALSQQIEDSKPKFRR